MTKIYDKLSVHILSNKYVNFKGLEYHNLKNLFAKK